MTSSPSTPQALEAESGMTLTVSKRFRFEAAHRFAHEAPDHPFSRLHGHSFEGCVELRGTPQGDGGFVHDLWAVERLLSDVLADFDHAYLNDIADLATPSLENIALTLFQRLSARLPALHAVEVGRPSCGESARVARS